MIGWVIQAMIGSWSQLIPAIGPGGPEAHARQRITLGRAGTARLVALNVGVLLTVIGSLVGAVPLATAGMVVCAGAVVASILLLVTAISIVPSGRVSRTVAVDRGF